MDVVFIALHGRTGKDGTFNLVGRLNPFTGSGRVDASRWIKHGEAPHAGVASPTPAWQMCDRMMRA